MLEWIIGGLAWAQSPQTTELSFLKDESVVFISETQKEPTPFLPLSDPNYSKYREELAKVMPYGNHCALFVNRMIRMRYGVPVYGDAWTMQLHPTNQQWVELVWRLPESEFNRKNNLQLLKKEDRIKHYQELYEVLDAQEDAQGVIGFVYTFSNHLEQLSQSTAKKTIAQTHVGYVAGKTSFSFKNDTEEALTLEKLIGEKYGNLHDFEKPFVAQKVNLETWLEPGDEYFYEDYSVEEYFMGVVEGSLLEVFLRKHRNNRINPLLRPASYSQITEALREKAQAYN